MSIEFLPPSWCFSYPTREKSLAGSGAVDEAAVKQVGDELRALKEKLKQEAPVSEQVGSRSYTCWVLCEKNVLVGCLH